MTYPALIRTFMLLLTLGCGAEAWADVAWFVAPYKRVPTAKPLRYCAMNDFTAQIRADGGDWREIEGLGNRCLVKVRASAATLSAITAAPGMTRLPLTRLDARLSALSATQRTALRQLLLDGGYTLDELNAAIPNLSQATLRDVLRFAVSRRQKPRYDAATDRIVLDGPPLPTGDVDALDGGVQ